MGGRLLPWLFMLLAASWCLVVPTSAQSPNAALLFPGGSNGAVSSVSLPALNLVSLPFTMEAWIYPTTGINDYGSVFFGRSGNPCGFFIRTTQSVANELRSVWNNLYSTTSTGLSVSLNAWHHVALVVTSTTQTLYLDNSVYTYPTEARAVCPFSGVSYFGYDPAVATRTFKGQMDEIRLWSVAKSLTDLQQSRYAPLNGNETGLVGYWNFNNRLAGSITDSVGTYSATPNGVSYVDSTVFNPQTLSVTVQSAKDASSLFGQVAPGSSANPTARLAFTLVSGVYQSFTLSSFVIDLSNSTNPADVIAVRAYYTADAFEFNGNTLWGAVNISAGATTATISGSSIVLVNGVYYFWLTVDVAPTAAVGNSVVIGISSASISSASTTNAPYPVAVITTSSPITVRDSSLFSPLSVLNVSVASNFGGVPTSQPTVSNPAIGSNFVAFQTSAVTTFAGQQYIIYWNRNYRVALTRRSVTNTSAGVTFGAWQEIEFSDYTITAARYSDNHYVVTMGICPNDGTIHFAFDMHGDPLHYRRSIAGLAYTDASSPLWSAASFSATLGYLVPGTNLVQVTYPRFIIRPDGNMQFEWRYGTSGAGDNHMHFYNGTSGTWTLIGKYGAGLSLNPTQNAYMFGVEFDRAGRLHLSWCWRLTPDALTNHDLYYGYSDDMGYTWKDYNGNQVAQVDTNPMTIGTPGIQIMSIGQNRGLINQESQAVDSKGGLHMLASYLLDSRPASTNFWGGRAATIDPQSGAMLRHVHLVNGTWRADVIGAATVSRSQIAVDGADNLYVVAPTWRVFFASSSNGWATWTSVDYAQSTKVINEGQIDRALLRDYNVLSFVFTNAQSQILVPTYSPPSISSSTPSISISSSAPSISSSEPSISSSTPSISSSTPSISSSTPLISSSTPSISSSTPSISSSPQPTPVADSPRALTPRHGRTSTYDAAHVRTVSRELLDRPLTLSPLGDAAIDDGLFPWTLPFAFRVGTVTTSSVTVSTNGNLQFGSADSTSYRFVPEPLPKGDGELLPLLSYLFTDLNATSPSQLQVGSLGVAPERVAVLRVSAVGTVSNRSASSSIDVLLFEGVNRIEVRYYSVGVFTERTLIALQNADVKDFAVFWNAEALTSDARALLDGSTIVLQPRAAFADANSARRLRRRLLFAM